MSSNKDRPSPGLMRLNVAVSLAVVLAGLAFVACGVFRYGVWQNNGPGPGFFPAIAGAIAAICAAIETFRRASVEPVGVRWQDFKPFAAAVVAVLLVPVIGMAESMTLFVFLWIKVLEQRSWIQALVSALVALVVVHLVFSVWLGVRFPDSLVPSLLTMGG